MTVYLVRHADAVSRQEWAHEDLLRPLTGKGFDQAQGLVDLLGDIRVTRFLTSPAVRCRQTLEPLASHLGLVIEETPALLEGTVVHEARALLDSVTAGDVVLCSHGDVIPDLVRRAQGRGMLVPGKSGCAKGSVWTFQHWDGTGFATGIYTPIPGA